MKRWCFSAFLSVSTVGLVFSCSGRAFHSVGGWRQKTWRHSYCVRADETWRRKWLCKRRVRRCWYLWRSSEIYMGASPCKVLYVMRSIFNLIRLSTGSQCRLCSIGDVDAVRLVRAVMRAEMFWILWSRDVSFWGMLPSSELKLSRRDVTNACVRMMVDFLSRYLRIRPMLLAAAIANWHVFLTCDLIVICVSIIAPRFLISGKRSKIQDQIECNFDTSWSNSLLAGWVFLLVMVLEVKDAKM